MHAPFVAVMTSLHIDHGLQDPLAHPNKKWNRWVALVLVPAPLNFKKGLLHYICRIQSRIHARSHPKGYDPLEPFPHRIEVVAPWSIGMHAIRACCWRGRR
jgi:hypothetical protein